MARLICFLIVWFTPQDSFFRETNRLFAHGTTAEHSGRNHKNGRLVTKKKIYIVRNVNNYDKEGIRKV